MSKTARKLINVLLTIIILCCIGYLVMLYRQYQSVEKYAAQLREKYVDNSRKDLLDIDFEALLERNGDIVAWLDIPDTRISYPVLKGEDNDTYLRTDLDHHYSTAGSLFIDAALSGTFSEPSNLIYGHHMHNGSMFADLSHYREQDYFDQHRELYLYLSDGRVYHYTAVAWLNPTADSHIYTFGYAADDIFAAYANDILSQSLIPAHRTIKAEDHLLILSTCERTANEKRLVLVAVLEDIR